ncbi:MAG: pyruvate, phosphate dikinase, partial [Myxococcota bacterium]|nr:pyruvate, phosphate dikinase [Myxococcota bacterium]
MTAVNKKKASAKVKQKGASAKASKSRTKRAAKSAAKKKTAAKKTSAKKSAKKSARKSAKKTGKKSAKNSSKKSTKKSAKKTAKKSVKKAAKKAPRKAAKKSSKAKPTKPQAAKASSTNASPAKTPSTRGPSTKVFYFGDGKASGRAEMKELLGGKGANLAEMTNLGIPVPPGFTVSTEVCGEFNRQGGTIPRSVRTEITDAIVRVEKSLGAKFGGAENPLLFSVRSGARASMPGMMDTVLNLGLNNDTVLGLAASANERFAYDSYRRFIQMYGDVVLNVPRDRFEMRIDDTKHAKGIVLDTELETEDLKRLVRDFLEIAEEQTGRPFPKDP